MKSSIQRLVLILATVILCNSMQILFADDDHAEKGHGKHHHIEHHDNHHNDDNKNYDINRSLKTIENQTYSEVCGACHFAYQPGLLPSASWTALLNTIPDHFGEDVELDNDSKSIITKYLQDNSAEKSTAKRAVKIAKSLKGQTPSRITEVPYIRRKHHEISAEVLNSEAIGGSLSNCVACHRSAEQGVYEEDDVLIPKQEKN